MSASWPFAKEPGCCFDTAGQSHGNSIAGKRGYHGCLIAKPEKASLGMPGTPSVAHAGDAVPATLHRSVNSPRKIGELGQQLGGKPVDSPGLLEANLRDGQA